MNEEKGLVGFLLVFLLICFAGLAAIPLVIWTPLESIDLFLGFLFALAGLTALAFIAGLINLLILCIQVLKGK